MGVQNQAWLHWGLSPETVQAQMLSWMKRSNHRWVLGQSLKCLPAQEAIRCLKPNCCSHWVGVSGAVYKMGSDPHRRSGSNWLEMDKSSRSHDPLCCSLTTKRFVWHCYVIFSCCSIYSLSFSDWGCGQFTRFFFSSAQIRKNFFIVLICLIMLQRRRGGMLCCSPVCKAAAGLGPETTSRIRKWALKRAQSMSKSQELTQSGDYCTWVKKEEC